MAKSIKPGDLGAAISRQLDIYHEDVINKLDKAGANAMKKLVKLTKETAPVGKREGRYRQHITSKVLEQSPRGSKRVWFVKEPDHRLTHLLVHGHVTKNGGRTKADPFLKNALNEVLPEYENAAKEAVKK